MKLEMNLIGTALFNFNQNFISVDYFKKRKVIGLSFSNTTNHLNDNCNSDLDYFEIGINGCDLNIFEEFADSCLSNFKGTILDDQKIIAKAKKLYDTLISYFKQQERLDAFKSSVQAKLDIRISHIRNANCFTSCTNRTKARFF